MATKATDNNDNAVAIPTISDYTFVRKLGSGAQAVVNLYKRKKDLKLFAIKEFTCDTSQPLTKLQSSAMKEADLLTLLPEHNNIVRCFGSWYQNNTFYMKIEYLDGVDLFDFQNANWRNISQSELLSIIKDTLSGISHLHKHGIMHRDLKPGNLFRTNSGTTKLFDLGLGKELKKSKEFTKSIVGTPAYASPEQIELWCGGDSSGYSTKHDLHQLAVIYFFLAAGYHPFLVVDNDPKREMKTYRNIRDKPLHLSSSDHVPYDQRILDLINKCGAKDPSKRPTANEALNEAITIDETIKMEKIVEDVIQSVIRNLVDAQNAKQGAKRVSSLVEKHFLRIKKKRKRTLTRWARSLKDDPSFKMFKQLQQMLKRERQEKELREKALIEENERKKKEQQAQKKERMQQEIGRQLQQQQQPARGICFDALPTKTSCGFTMPQKDFTYVVLIVIVILAFMASCLFFRDQLYKKDLEINSLGKRTCNIVTYPEEGTENLHNPYIVSTVSWYSTKYKEGYAGSGIHKNKKYFLVVMNSSHYNKFGGTNKDGNYDIPKDRQGEACDAFNARVGTYEEMVFFQKNDGAQWCSCSHVADKSTSHYPMQTGGSGGCGGKSAGVRLCGGGNANVFCVRDPVPSWARCIISK